jgi:putative transposase
MARRLRVEFPGAIYHVMNRGDRKEEIFRDDRDRQCYWETLTEVCDKTSWEVHALCLMRNHFHLVVETPEGNLVAGMHWFLGTYTGRFNRRHKLTGHLFAGRYKSPLVSPEGGYLRAVCEYVHLNPARAKVVSGEQRLQEYRWSSFPEYLKPPSRRPAWLRVDRVFGEYGIPRDSAAGRREYEKLVELRRRATMSEWEDLDAIRRDWCLGDEEFRQEMLDRVAVKAGRSHYGLEIQQSAGARAERIVAEELKRLKWTKDDLKAKRKGDLAKVRMAIRLRQETVMTLDWIAERLCMGTRGHLAHLLYWAGRDRLRGEHNTTD